MQEVEFEGGRLTTVTLARYRLYAAFPFLRYLFINIIYCLLHCFKFESMIRLLFYSFHLIIDAADCHHA